MIDTLSNRPITTIQIRDASQTIVNIPDRPSPSTDVTRSGARDRRQIGEYGDNAHDNSRPSVRLECRTV
jgi:hypothetical protein